jgi:hypothetical protein
MKLLGRDFDAARLLERLEERLKARGLSDTAGPSATTGVEPRVDPLSFNLEAMDENVDPTEGLPLETHRAGLGRGVLVAKWAFRKTCQVFINEALGRQKVFNGLSRDAYAQVAAEVQRLRRELEALQEQLRAGEGKAKGRRRAAAPAAGPARLPDR